MCLYLILVWVAVFAWVFAPELGEYFHCVQEIWECVSIVIAGIALAFGSYGFGISGLKSDEKTTDSRD